MDLTLQHKKKEKFEATTMIDTHLWPALGSACGGFDYDNETNLLTRNGINDL